MHLQACDVKSKEEKSGPENMLTDSPTGDGTTDSLMNVNNNNMRFILKLNFEHALKTNWICLFSKGFLTESGKKRASVILSTEDQSNFQVTQMTIKVSLRFDFTVSLKKFDNADSDSMSVDDT